jgi:hypothetical protein
VRHIPEDELHAYLDQALSRSQCIEIETHLSLCAGCRKARDGAAALRDRTTALLARSMPRVVTPPVYASLAQRAVTHRRHSWRRSALWAASLAGALVGGWGLRAVLDPHPAEGTVAMAPAPLPALNDAPATDLPINPSEAVDAPLNEPVTVEQTQTAPRWSRTQVRLAGGGPPAPADQLDEPESLPAAATDALDALWSPVTLEEAEEATGALVPTIPGLPVVEIRLRRGGPQERPILMVSQHHPTGEMIHTIEGPVSTVASVVAAQLEQHFRSSEPTRSLPDYLDTPDGIRRTSRVLVVVSRLPADSLNAMAQAVVLK